MKCLAQVVVLCGFAGVSAAAAAQQPVTLDSTDDFKRGNNEGLILAAQDRVTRDRITAGALGSWSSSTALPTGRVIHTSVAHNGFVYVFGGYDDTWTLTSNVLVAPISADGSVGAWSSTTALPSARDFFSAVAYNGFIYVIGGFDGDVFLSDVLVAPISADGSVGAWSSTTALPWGRDGHAAFAYNGFLYVTGGFDGYEVYGVLSDVLVAPINGDGTVGSWSSSTALPSARNVHSSNAHNGFVYVIGGQDDSYVNLTDVLVAPLAADGSVGAWSSTTGLPTGRIDHSAITHNGFVYVIGGVDTDFNYVTDVPVAPINADGSVGAWSTATALSSGRMFSTSVVHDDFVYTIGGSDANSTVLSDVLVASITADSGNANQTPNRLRGFYSHLVDLQGDMSTLFVTLNGHLSPGGAIRLQVRSAPDATGVFGPETVVDPAALANPIQIPGSGRYVWIRITLDDTAAGAVDDPTYISDITVSDMPPPAAGVVYDGLAADVDTQTATSTIEANWTGFIPTAGDNIAFYQWAIGTAPGLTNVQNWVNVGLATTATNSALSLTPGMKFISVRATSVSGLTSPVATSDGVQVLASSDPGGGGGSDHKSRCGQSASSAPGSALAMLAGIALLAWASARRRPCKAGLLNLQILVRC